MLRRTALILIVVTLLTLVAPAPVAAIGLVVDGRALAPDVPPQVIGGRVLVPLRFVGEALGLDVRWDAAAQAAVVAGPGLEIVLPVGAARAVVNGGRVPIDVPARLIAGRVMVPLRFVAETLGAGVTWDAAQQTVRIVTAGGARVVTAHAVLEAQGAAAESQLPDLARRFEELYPEVVAQLGFEPALPVSVRFFSDRAGFTDFLYDRLVLRAGDVGRFACGVAHPAFGIAMPLVEDCWEPEVTLVHELVHMVSFATGVELPAWLDEGLAKEMELLVLYPDAGDPVGGRLRGMNLEAVLQQARAGTLHGFAQTSEEVIDALDSYPAHEQGQVAVRFLLEHGGMEAFRRFLQAAREVGADAAFRQVYNVSMDEITTFVANRLLDKEAYRPQSVRVGLRLSGTGEVVAFSEGYPTATGRRYADAAAEIVMAPGSPASYSLDAAGGNWTLQEVPKEAAVIYLVPERRPVYGGRTVTQMAIVIRNGIGSYYWSHNVLFFEDGGSEVLETPELPDGSAVTLVRSR